MQVEDLIAATFFVGFPTPLADIEPAEEYH
jgi:hypothetical protein